MPSLVLAVRQLVTYTCQNTAALLMPFDASRASLVVSAMSPWVGRAVFYFVYDKKLD